MNDPDRYVMVVTSLPHLETLFRAKQPPLSRLRLDRRLRLLTDEDGQKLRLIESALNWGEISNSATDEDIVTRGKNALEKVDSPTLRRIVRDRLEMRTLVAALRRRSQGEGPPGQGSVWGFGRWTRHIARNWTERSFRLDTVFPWAPEAVRLMEHDDTVGFERLILDTAHRSLQRLGNEHFFDLEAVVIYVLQWNIFDRWARAKAEDAVKRFDTLTTAGLGDYATISFEGAR